MLSTDDATGLADLYAQYWSQVKTYCRRKLGNDHDAEDAALEVFARAADFEGGVTGTAHKWLITVARNVCVDELRRREREASCAEFIVRDDERRGVPNAETDAIGNIFTSQLLAGLTELERVVVVRHWLDDWSLEQIAGSMGRQASATRHAFGRARAKLACRTREAEIAAIAAAVGLARWLHRRITPAAVSPVDFSAMAATVPAALMIAASAIYSVSGTSSVRPESARPVGPVALYPASHPNVAAALAQTGAGSPSVRAATSFLPTMVSGSRPGQSSVQPTDVQASPNYSSDHTMYEIGHPANCLQCFNIFRSTDSGRSWTNLGGSGLTLGSLILPAASTSLGRFYAADAGHLQITTDGGATFGPAIPFTGYASAAPAWVAGDVVIANQALWAYQPNPAGLHLITTLPVGITAEGPATAAGSELLIPSAQIGVTSANLRAIACAVTCRALGTIPWSLPTGFDLSPTYASDRTLIAVSGAGVAISVDGGVTFRVVALSDQSTLVDAAIVRSGRGLTLAGLIARGSSIGVTVAPVSSVAFGRVRVLVPRVPSAAVDLIRSFSDGRLLISTYDPNLGENLEMVSGDGGDSWARAVLA